MYFSITPPQWSKMLLHKKIWRIRFSSSCGTGIPFKWRSPIRSFGAPKSLLAQLSGVMRAAARLILVLPRQSHVTSEIRARLHWLDVPSRVQFKLCCLAFRCLHGSAPPYLAGYFTLVSSIEGRSQLRSAAAGLLLVPRTWTVTIGPRAFAVSSPAAWNSLPASFRDPSISLPSFRKKLKTYLFNTPTWLSDYCLVIHLIIFLDS